ncbi:MAG: nitrous oxide reductase accessory protein NosL [Desulfomonilaceae bacterium]
MSKKLIDLSAAYLVLGSLVKGPMGYDLIAFTNKDETADFARKYSGKWIVQLHEIPKIIPKEKHGSDVAPDKRIQDKEKASESHVHPKP